MKRLSAMAMGFLLLCALGASAQGTVRVACDDYAPFKLVDNDKITGGLDIEYMDEVFKRANLAPRYELFPWVRCLQMTKDGEVDFLSGVTKKEDRESYMYFIEPPYKTRSSKVFFVRKGAAAAFSQLASFEGKTVGILRAAKYFEAFDANTAIKRYEVNADIDGLRMVLGGRIDAAVVTEEIGDHLVRTTPELEGGIEKAAYRYDAPVLVYFTISRKSPLLAKKDLIEGIVADMARKREFEAIYRRYFAIK